MKLPRDGGEAGLFRRRGAAIAVSTCALLGFTIVESTRGADQAVAGPAPTFQQYCFQCHGANSPMAGVSLTKIVGQSSMAESYQTWEKVATVLEQHRMPPKGMPQPTEEQRAAAISWIRAELRAAANKNAGDPGRVTVRRLTSGEYDYVIQDLTGIDMDTGIDASSDSVGGEGFSNFGDVQFMQDANLQRYLEAAKIVAAHAVVGAGPLSFYQDPGKTGFEMSAIARIKKIYTEQGFRTVSGEGGVAYGLDKYGKGFYAAWRYQHRAELGKPNLTLKEIAAQEGITARWAEHLNSVLNRKDLGYPASDMAARFHKFPPVSSGEKAVREASADLQKQVVTWPLWLFARGDVAVGGAGDESPLIINDISLKVEGKRHFQFLRGGRGGAAGRGPAPSAAPMVFINVAAVNPTAKGKPVVVWRNATIGFRAAMARPATPPADAAAADAGAGAAAVRRGLPPVPRVPLREAVTEASAAKLNFGKSIDGVELGPDDFEAEGNVAFEVKLPQGMTTFDLQIDAEVGADRDQVFRIVFNDRAEGAPRGIPVRGLLGDPASQGYQTFKKGVLELVALMPPNSNTEPTPADKDPIPLPFDSAFNVPEHDEFDNVVKYIREDKFLYDHVLDDDARKRVDEAWTDLYASFEYHDHYVKLLAAHYKIDLHGKHISQLTPADLAAMPAEARGYMEPQIAEYKRVVAAQAAARPKRVDDTLEFASRAWRRPLTPQEKQSLRAFYDKVMTAEPDPDKAIRAVIARILVSPAFLYRVEQPSESAAAKPLSSWEMASRLSFFLWASVPDDELRRAAIANELIDPAQVRKQVKRMATDPKARRMATEFFGQWLGFYHFDQHKGVDTSRSPEFTNEVRESMYDEAVSFFEHIVRKDRPVREILAANYTFLDDALAKYYGVKQEIKSKTAVLVENVPNRGGALRLGAILTATSAPLRTSPVKRGDWVLRRILGSGTPPPPADAGSLPNDPKLFGGLSNKQRLEQHKRNATCASCHKLIDPLGFAFEHYDHTGRWREQYADGKPVEDDSKFSDGTEVAGVDGLLKYLETQQQRVIRTMARKLIGYSLGRTVQLSDLPLVEQIVAAGGNAKMTDVLAEIAASRQFRYRPARETAPAVAAVHTNSSKAGAR